MREAGGQVRGEKEMNRFNLRQTKAQLLTGALLFVVFTALWLVMSSFLSLRTKSKVTGGEPPIAINDLPVPKSSAPSTEIKDVKTSPNSVPQFDLPPPPTSRIVTDQVKDEIGHGPSKNQIFRLIAESDAQKVFRELQSQQGKDPQIVELETQLSAFLAKEKWLRDYDRAYVKAYTDTFIENAKREGWKVAFNEKLEIVEFARIRRLEPIRFPQSESSLAGDEGVGIYEALEITENVLSPNPHHRFFSESACLVSQSSGHPQN